eukprot:6195279-Pleurochrysis_carterae.AAC.4
MPFSCANFSHRVSGRGFGSGFSRGKIDSGFGSIITDFWGCSLRSSYSLFASSCTLSRACWRRYSSPDALNATSSIGDGSNALKWPRSYERTSSLSTATEGRPAAAFDSTLAASNALTSSGAGAAAVDSTYAQSGQIDCMAIQREDRMKQIKHLV